MNRAQGVSETPWQNYGGEFVAPINPQQYTGIGNVNQYAFAAQPTLGVAQNMAWNAAQPISYADIARYQNPWTQNVVGATEAQFNNQNIQQLQNVRGNAIAQGALGGDREAVAEAELANQQNLAQAPVIANLMSQGYTQGVNTALTEQQALASGAYSLGNLGVAGQTAGLTGAGAQIQAGGLEQTTQQAADTAAYNQWLASRAYPFQTTQWLAGLDTGVGSQMGGTSTTQAPTPSPWSQIAGLGIGSIGMLGGTGAFGSSGWLAPAVRGLFGGAGGAGANRGGRINGVAGYEDGGGVSPLPYASPGRAWEPYAGGHGWVPTAAMTHGRGPPVPPRPPQQEDPMKLGEQVAGLAKYFKSGQGPMQITPNPVPATPVGTVVPTGVAPGAWSPYPDSGSASQIYRDGGVVRGYADGGTPDDIGLPAMPYAPSLGRRVGEATLPYLPGHGLYNYATAERPPPDITPNVAGKVPSATHDPYLGGAVRDIAGLGMMAIPFGGPEAAMERLSEAATGLTRPFAGETVQSMRTVGGFGDFGAPAAAGAAGVAGSMGTPSVAEATEMSQRTRAAIEKAIGPRPELPDVGAALGPRPAALPEEQAQIDKLSGQIKAFETARDTGLDKIDRKKAIALKAADSGPKAQAAAGQPFENDKAQLRASHAGNVAPLNEQIATINKQVTGRQNDYDERVKGLQGDTQKRQLDYDDKAAEFLRQTAPFAAREPEQQKWFSRAPLIAGATGFFPSLAGGKLPFKAQMGLAGTMGVLGAAEGGVGALYPVMEDLKQPEGSEARTQAQQKLGDPGFWAKEVGGEMGLAVASSMAGSGIGMKTGKTISDARNFIGSFSKSGVAGPATALPRYPDLKDAAAVRRYQAGLKQDTAGRWYEPGKGMVAKDYWPAARPSGKVVPIQAAEAYGGVVRGYWGGGSPFAEAPADDLYGGVAPQYVSDPASIRTNNPGAQWMGPVARQFGATTSEGLGGGNNAAVFPDSESGAAAQFALWGHNYTGMPLATAINKWSGNNSPREYTNFIARSMGISPDTVLTPQILAGPQGIALAKAQAQWEAGRPYPMTDAQWTEAQARGMQDVRPTQAAYRNHGVAGGYGDLVPLSPSSGSQPTGVAPSGIDLSSNSKLWPSLMAAGFGMMASRSPYPLQAIGEGALTGMGAYTKVSELESARAMKQSEIDLQAQKLWQANETERRKLAMDAAKLERTPVPVDQFGRLGVPDLAHPGRFKDPITGQPVAPLGEGVPSGQSPTSPMAPSGTQADGMRMISSVQLPLGKEEQAMRAFAVQANPEDIQRGQSTTPSQDEPRNWEYLKSVPPEVAREVVAIDQGLQPPPSPYTLYGGKSPRASAINNALRGFDPGYDYNSFRAAYQFGAGGQGNQIRAFNTAIYHLNSLEALAKKLNPGDIPAANAVVNFIKTQLGHPEVTNLETARQFVGGEVIKAVVGTRSAEQERQEARKMFSPNMSLEQILGAADTDRDFMGGQLRGLKQQYMASTRRNDFEDRYLVPEARAALEGKRTGPAPTTPATQTSQRPSNVPAGSLRSPTTGQWKGPDGTIYRPDGSILQKAGQ